ncbi:MULTISPECIES: SGNH/GDSL hydrolase family protein [Olivibacter]|jgi:lysophospholipase L1-like esterase|uniref:SGNH/GDSL hydrolase family protein n=1 Tax=Olivibacter oleidegradans TaxID=760123 RepID=A0ABV6HI27_9SPHI|nr:MULTISPECIES: SGNH/GDSL hydrolase family protein [Olivibacter]MDM8174641.1 SGNH/GDSL hydrolase family protein [Olivibacter sp. 47]QEL01441.1 SGNH/GDSL hydrolase family protein [Olivibacter sp. LS-1]
MKKEITASRRSFLKKASLSLLTTLPIADALCKANQLIDNSSSIQLQRDDIILFQGDSITDAGRKRNDHSMNNPLALGSGYAFLVTSQLQFDHPDKPMVFYNRGISGNKVYQLAERWEEDCLKLKPNVLSILVGVNDFWHTKTKGYQGTTRDFRQSYEQLLKATKARLPQVKLIIGEPWYQPGFKGSPYEALHPEFASYQSIVKELAQQFKAAFIPYQAIFNEARKIAPDNHWSWDGVHPTVAGAWLIAHSWQKAIEI